MNILRDNTALVTGATTGIGRTEAAAFASEGARVAVVGADLAGGVGRRRARPHPRATERLGRVDIVVSQSMEVETSVQRN